MATPLPPFEILRALRSRSGHTVRSLAVAAGYAGGSSVQTLEKPERGSKPFSLAQVRKLAPHLIGKGSPPIAVDEVAALLGPPPLPFSTVNQRAIVYDLLGLPLPDDVRESVSVIPTPVYLMPVVGRVQASFWMASAPSIDAPEEHIAIPFDPDIPIAEQYALKVVGPSMNKVASEGAYAICARYGSSPKRAKQNAIVHVERERFGEIEWTLKRVKWDQDGASLWPESHDPAFQDPIPLLDGDSDGSIRFLGIALGFYTKLSR